MRGVAEQSIGWLVLAGIVLAIVLARKRYQGKYSADVAQARAEGYAAAKVELGVSQSVTVTAGNVSSDAGGLDHDCLDPFACARCSVVLLRVLRAGGRGAPAVAGSSIGGQYDDDDDDDDDRTSAAYYGGVDERTNRVLGSIGIDHSGRGAGNGHAADCGVDPGGVAVVPGASLDGVSARRPELLADMVRRPWAYDEADPRFERGVPVSRGRGGRGPGR